MISARTAGTVSLSPTDKYGSKIRSWLEQIKIGDMLEGKLLGREVWGAEQTLKALEEECGVTADSVLLKAHLDVANVAKDPLAG